MKPDNSFFNFKAVLTVVPIVLLVLAGCGSGGGSTGTTTSTTIPAPEVISGGVALTIQDAANKQLIQEMVTVTVQGNNAANFVNPDGQSGPYSVTDGTLTLQLDGATVPAGEMVNATIVASSDNYFASSKLVSVPGNDVLPETILLTSKQSSATSDVQVVERTGTADATNGTTAAIVVATTAVNNDVQQNSTVEVTIPANTTLLDANGDAVTGNVAVNVAYFPNDAVTAEAGPDSPLEAFPGGLVAVVADPGAESSEGVSPGEVVNFVSGGFVAV